MGVHWHRSALLAVQELVPVALRRELHGFMENSGMLNIGKACTNRRYLGSRYRLFKGRFIVIYFPSMTDPHTIDVFDLQRFTGELP